MSFLNRNLSRTIKAAVRGKHTLPKLPYDYGALAPIISKDILEVHHGKHHQTYVNNLNAVEEQMTEAHSKKDVNKVVELSKNYAFNWGGHLNHSIYWQNLSPTKSEPSADLKKAIEEQFSSFEQFKKDLSALSVGVQGSGWGWLGYNKKSKKLQILAVGNQEPLQAVTGLVPLFAIDVWEHAYYLQYKNVRAKYVEAIWDIANWKDISDRYAEATCN
uniref:Superoxide dismutase n=1 Tax=Glossina pallidipes TaxID=7398 RepID=A0A1A9Z4G1_GLOPL